MWKQTRGRGEENGKEGFQDHQERVEVVEVEQLVHIGNML